MLCHPSKNQPNPKNLPSHLAYPTTSHINFDKNNTEKTRNNINRTLYLRKLNVIDINKIQYVYWSWMNVYLLEKV